MIRWIQIFVRRYHITKICIHLIMWLYPLIISPSFLFVRSTIYKWHVVYFRYSDHNHHYLLSAITQMVCNCILIRYFFSPFFFSLFISLFPSLFSSSADLSFSLSSSSFLYLFFHRFLTVPFLSLRLLFSICYSSLLDFYAFRL